MAILDLMMHEMEGLECLRRIKALRPELPVIISSGFGEQQEFEQLKQEGVDAFLPKPYKLKKRLSLISDIIQTRRNIC